MHALFIVSEEGFWAEECFEPMKTLQKHGFDITVATPSGADPVVDESSLDPERIGDEHSREYGGMNAAESCMNNPVPVAEAVDMAVDAVVLPGGHGTVFDVNHDHHAQQIVADAVTHNKALIICHAVGILGFVRDTDGSFIIDGRNVTGFPNEWENETVDEAERLPNGVKLPYRVEDEVKAAGGNWDAQLAQDTSVTVDGNLITARGPESSEDGANTLLDEMGVDHA